MAIQIVEAISETKYLDAFNNQQVKYRSSLGTTPLRSTLTVSEGVANGSSPSVSITPSPSGDFLFNFKELFKIMVNKNNFRDDFYTTGVGGLFTKKDVDVFKLLNVEYKIEFIDGTKETLTKVYRVMRSVIQLDDYRRNMVFSSLPNLAILSPITQGNVTNLKTKFWRNYPFDLSVYVGTSQNLNLKDSAGLSLINFTPPIGVTRLLISTGFGGITGFITAPEGENKYTLSGLSPETTVEFTVETIQTEPDCDDIYLKWCLDGGGWAYYMFNEHRDSVVVKETNSFRNNFGNIGSQTSTFTSMGFDKIRKKLLFVDGLTPEEQLYVSTIIGSPKVYMYVGKYRSIVKQEDWIEVEVDSNTTITKSRYLRNADIKFSISQPYNNTLTI